AVVASLAGSARSSAKDTPTTPIYTLSLHDALPIYRCAPPTDGHAPCGATHPAGHVPGIPSAHRVAPSALRGGRHPAPSLPALPRSEEHTSELQSRENLVCRLLLEKKKHSGELV